MIEKAHLRKSTEQQRLTLKASFDRALDLAGGPTSMQFETRVVVGNLSKYGSPHDPMFAPIDVVLDVDLKAREPVVTRALAQAQGFDLVPLQPVADVKPWAAEMGDLAEDNGQLLSRLGEAASDRSITPAEARDCLARAEVLKQQLAEITARLVAIAEGSGS